MFVEGGGRLCHGTMAQWPVKPAETQPAVIELAAIELLTSLRRIFDCRYSSRVFVSRASVVDV